MRFPTRESPRTTTATRIIAVMCEHSDDSSIFGVSSRLLAREESRGGGAATMAAMVMVAVAVAVAVKVVVVVVVMTVAAAMVVVVV